MSILVFANNATTTLSVAALSSDTSIVVTNGAVFPSPAGGQYFILTLTSVSTGSQEVCWCTARSGNTLTIARGKEGTAPQSFLVGDHVDMYPTGGTQQALVQIDQLQNGTYTTATAGGTANALTANISSNLTAIPNGFNLTILSNAANTGASTLQITLTSPITGTPTVTTAYPIVTGGNVPLLAGAIPSVGYPCQFTFSSVYNAFVLQNSVNVIDSTFVTISNLQSQSLVYASAGGTTDALTVTVAANGITTLIDGARVAFKAAYANATTSPTLNVTYGSTATGAKPLYKFNGQALALADIAGSGAVCECTYSSTYSGWILTNPRTNYDLVSSVTAGTGILASPTSGQGAVVITNTGVTTFNGSNGAITVTAASLGAVSLTGTQTISAINTFSGTNTFINTNTFSSSVNFNGNNVYTGTNTYSQPQVVNISTGGVSSVGYTVNSGSYTGFLSSNSLQLYGNGTGIFCPGSSLDVQFSGTATAFFLQSGNFSITGDINNCQNIYAQVQGYKTGGGSWASISDERLKSNINPLKNSLSLINSLAPVSYTWNYENNEPTVGFIAQDVQKVLPNAITTIEPNKDQASYVTDNKLLSLGFQNDMFAYLVGAIQELSAIVTAQAADISALKTKVGI